MFGELRNKRIIRDMLEAALRFWHVLPPFIIELHAHRTDRTACVDNYQNHPGSNKGANSNKIDGNHAMLP
jgi:hypothetical protein